MTNPSDLHVMQSENIFRTLIEESLTPVGLYVGDDLVIKVANKAMVTLWGKGDDVIGKPYFDLLPELRSQPLYNVLPNVYKTGITYQAKEEKVNLLVNGSIQTFYLNLSLQPLKDNEGNVWGILSTCTDITELALAAQDAKQRKFSDHKNLADSEHLLQNITAAAPITLWMSDEQGAINYVNKTWTAWTGMTIKETLGKGWLNAILWEDRQRAADKFMSDLTTRLPYEVDFRILNKDGDIRWCVATGNPQYRKDGTFAGYIGACTDVTEKKLAEQQAFLKNEELNDQIKQFEFVTSFMPVQLWTATVDGNMDYFNQRALDFFGVKSDKLTGSQWILRVHPADRDGCIEAWSNSLQTGELYEYEFRLRDKNGSYKWHLVRGLPFISDNKIVKWFGTNTDIDEQKILQRQKDDFLGIASHELKTPVTSIKAYAQVLGAMLAKEGEQKKADMVLRMDAQVNRLTNLIGDLLDVTKINSGKLQFNKTWFDLNRAITETVEDLQHTTHRHQLIMELNEIGDIFSDKDRIGQVTTNLISNAIKYSPNADKIIIETKVLDGHAVVSVKDFGIGIPADKTDLVFEQFYRVSGAKQHTFPGLGLGLYISSEIIKREGGKMWVNSVEGKGSDFCFSLPVNN